jgi:hypothetical protein
MATVVGAAGQTGCTAGALPGVLDASGLTRVAVTPPAHLVSPPVLRLLYPIAAVPARASAKSGNRPLW